MISTLLNILFTRYNDILPGKLLFFRKSSWHVLFVILGGLVGYLSIFLYLLGVRIWLCLQ